jgi:hypothetical protein
MQQAQANAVAVNSQWGYPASSQVFPSFHQENVDICWEL